MNQTNQIDAFILSPMEEPQLEMVAGPYAELAMDCRAIAISELCGTELLNLLVYQDWLAIYGEDFRTDQSHLMVIRGGGEALQYFKKVIEAWKLGEQELANKMFQKEIV